MAISAGDRNHRITFQQKEVKRDPLGGKGETYWTDVISVWAKRTNQLSVTAEIVAAGSDRYREQVRFDILPRAIDPQWRIVDRRGVAYDIKSVGTSNDRSETAVIAVAGLNNG